VHAALRRSHSRQVRSSEAVRKASLLGDMHSATTRPVCPCAQRERV
jgi:hypothetical protein